MAIVGGMKAAGWTSQRSRDFPAICHTRQTRCTPSAHFVGSILAVLSFWAVAEFASRLLREGWAHDAIKTIEEFVLVGVVIWLAARLAVRLWNRREHVDSDEN